MTAAADDPRRVRHGADAVGAIASVAGLDDDRVLVAALLAIDPVGLGGAVLDHPSHDAARAWTVLLQRLLPAGAPLRRVPIGVTADRLIGGVDLAATLAQGRVVAERGVLAAADGGVVVLPMAERVATAGRTVLADVLDRQGVQVARDGVAERHAARVVAVLQDESTEDEAVHPALVDRLAFRVADLLAPPRCDARALIDAVSAARARVGAVAMPERWFEAVGASTVLFGVDSTRAALFTVRCARAHAAQ